MRALNHLICLSLLLSGCAELSNFRTDDDQVFRGVVVGAADPDACEGVADCSFIRRGFEAGATLELVFDPDPAADVPGTLTTTGEACGITFDGVPLQTIQALQHDQLALYDFPGGGRLRNYIFSARPDVGPLAGRDVMVFISLLRGGRIEVRVVSGSGEVACDPTDCAQLASTDCDYFGLFTLKREPR